MATENDIYSLSSKIISCYLQDKILPLAKENEANTVQIVNAFLFPNFMNMNGVKSDAMTSITPSIMEWYSADIEVPVCSDANCQET